MSLPLLFSFLCFLSSISAQNPCSPLIITQTDLDGQIIQLEWFNDEKYVYAVTRNSIWVSQDEGQTWSQRQLGAGSIVGLFLTAAENQQFVLEYESSISKLWKTSDHGSTWSLASNSSSKRDHSNEYLKQTGSKLNIYDVLPHPTQQDWVAIHTYTNECLGPVSDVHPCHFDIKLSKDFGETWSSLSYNVVEFDWADAGEDGIPIENCMQLKAVNSSADIRTSTFAFQHSTNLFQKVDTEIPQTVDFAFYYDILYVAQKTSKGIQLLVSSDQAKTIIPARFPTDLQQNYYSILSGIKGLSYVAVDHTAPGSSVKWANLYVTDFTSDSYVLSLEFVRKESRAVNFVFGGIDGIQLANVYDLGKDEAFPTSKSAVVSAISYNNGGIWQYMHDTSKDRIHIQGFATANQKPEISPNAPGIIAALGNTGETLDDDAADVYLSRDAGLYWSRVKVGSAHFGMTDHGGLLLLANDQGPTHWFLYSWDQGGSFANCSFYDTPELVISIETSPSATSQNFMILGEKSDSGTGFITHVDFSNLHTAQCTESDYEWWAPTDDEAPESDEKECLLGRQVSFQRRKKDSKCFSPEASEPEKIETLCSCIREDYQCDFCYQMKEFDTTDEKCYLICDYDPSQPPASCHGTYLKTQGYRKVPGDMCEGGVDLNPQVCTCQGVCESVSTTGTSQSSTTSSSSGGDDGPSSGAVAAVVILTIIVLIGASIGALYYFYKTNEEVKRTLDQYLPKQLIFAQEPDVEYSNLNTQPKDQALDIDPFAEEEENTTGNVHDDFDPRGTSGPVSSANQTPNQSLL